MIKTGVFFARASCSGYIKTSSINGGPYRLVRPTQQLLVRGVTNKRCISSNAARALLGLPAKTTKKSSRADTSSSSLTLKELRHAYFAAAKKCHPDMVKGHSDNNDNNNTQSSSSSSSLDFLQVTRAYEVLQNEITQKNLQEVLQDAISPDEEAEFRNACKTWLGIDAEIVEECKQSPMFRKWLSGRTDAAYHWKTFFLQHGGLAPKLRSSKQPGHLLSSGDNGSAGLRSHTTRRKRK